MGHSIYKGKAALTVEPRAPEFTPLEVCYAWSFGSSHCCIFCYVISFTSRILYEKLKCLSYSQVHLNFHGRDA